MKFKKKPVVVEAEQWFSVSPYDGTQRVVDYFRDPHISGDRRCFQPGCPAMMHDHGWMDTPEGGHRVCPGDWIITGIAGEKYPCKPDIFERTYEPLPKGGDDQK